MTAGPVIDVSPSKTTSSWKRPTVAVVAGSKAVDVVTFWKWVVVTGWSILCKSKDTVASPAEPLETFGAGCVQDESLLESYKFSTENCFTVFLDDDLLESLDCLDEKSLGMRPTVSPSASLSVTDALAAIDI